MPQLSDFLTRFRPVGAPGSAGTAAVPADKAAALAAELDPVLDLLAKTDEHCAGVIAAAEQRAAELASEAAARAARIAAEGRRQAETARAVAADQVMAAAGEREAELDRVTADALRAKPRPAEADIVALIRQAIEFVESGPAAPGPAAPGPAEPGP